MDLHGTRGTPVNHGVGRPKRGEYYGSVPSTPTEVYGVGSESPVS